jgi:hypothetical protein
VKCLYCKLEVWNRNPSRLALHPSGDGGLHDASNSFSGISICAGVPSGVTDRAKEEMAAKVAKMARKLSLAQLAKTAKKARNRLTPKKVN